MNFTFVLHSNSYYLRISSLYVTCTLFVNANSNIEIYSNIQIFIMKIPNKGELQQIALNHSSDIDFKDFMKIYKKCTAEPYSFLVNDTTLPPNNPLRFRKNLFG